MKLGSGDQSTKTWSWGILVLLVCLTGCQRLSLPVPEVPPATNAVPTATALSDQEEGSSQEVGNPPGPVLTIALLPEGEFLAGVGPIGDAETGFEWHLYRGRGDDWRPLTWPPEAIPRSLHPDPRSDLLYAVPYSNALFGRGQAWGLMRSADGGRSWKQMLTGLGDPYVMDLALSPTIPSNGTPTLFAITWYSGAYRSVDAGETWESMPLDEVVEPSGGPNPYDLAVAVSPDYGDSSDKGVLIASFSRKLHRWDTQTQSWQTVSLTVTTTAEDFDPPESQLTAGHIAFSPDFAQDGTIYLYSGYAGLFRSADRGETWQSISRRLALPPPFVNDFHLAVASADEAYVLLDSDQADPRSGRPICTLYRTRDGGRSWEELADPPTLGWISTFALARDDEGQTVLHLGGSQGGVSSHRVDELSWK
jgi:photosystem II stability/assembly factor-like uncharacterized protein